MTALALTFLVGCSPTEARHKAAGNVLFKKGDFDGALREYDAAIAANGKDANGYTLRGNVHFERERYAEAERDYRAALERMPEARAARQGIAQIALRTGRDDEARKQYEAMIAEVASDVEAHAALGKLLFRAGELEGAERHLRDALMYAQNDTATLYTLGLVLAKKRQLDPALEIFARLDATDPKRPYAPYGRAVAYARLDRRDDALAALREAFARGMTDVDAVKRDDAFERLRDDARFVAIVKR